MKRHLRHLQEQASGGYHMQVSDWPRFDLAGFDWVCTSQVCHRVRCAAPPQLCQWTAAPSLPRTSTPSRPQSSADCAQSGPRPHGSAGEGGRTRADPGSIAFLYELQEGACPKSYGLQVMPCSLRSGEQSADVCMWEAMVHASNHAAERLSCEQSAPVELGT